MPVISNPSFFASPACGVMIVKGVLEFVAIPITSPSRTKNLDSGKSKLRLSFGAPEPMTQQSPSNSEAFVIGTTSG